MLRNISSILHFAVAFLLLACSDDNPVYVPVDYVTYEVNLNNRSDDRFKVKVLLPQLSAADDIFQFAATAPGLYSVTDIGRFVRDFKAYDRNGRQLTVEMVNTNEYRLGDPANTVWVEYTARDTWDTVNTMNPIPKMAGASLENDHALINTYCLFGYPVNMKDQKMLVKLALPSGWNVGTALTKNERDYYEAKDFDQLVDSPFLVGELTQHQQNVSGSEVDVYCYSADDAANANDISASIADVIESAELFLGGIPVDRYAFLFHFGEFNSGAWEHSYSSTYVLSSFVPENVKWITAHEFFHIVTPLNIHSEIIQDFDFVNPTPSQHLWLYEGVTEWAAFTMLMRAGKITDDLYLARMIDKIRIDRGYYDENASLVDISINSYSPEGSRQYANVYYRGALVAMLLDIRLLELSGGTKGLRELILELIQTYGPDAPFDEDAFFDVLKDMTYPEIEDFITKYIKGHDTMPYVEYFKKVGIQFVDGLDPQWYRIENPTASQAALYEAWTKNL